MYRGILFFAFMLLNLNLLIGRPVKVLFIGNGILSFNSIPWEFKDLAESAGQEISLDAYMKDFYSLSIHNGLMGDTIAIAKIKSEKWDFIVLQEQSFFPVIPEMTRNFTVPAIKNLSKIIKENHYCTRIILFMTWAWPLGNTYCVNIDSLGNPCSIPFMDFFHMHDSLEASYLRLADTIGGELAPVGTAWKNSFNQDPRVNLFWKDTNLPDHAGAYLSACVLYSTIFQKSTISLTYTSSLSEKEANFLQQVATYTVLPDREKWRIQLSESLPNPSFDYVIQHNQVQFIDQSANGDIWYWEFGDGSDSWEKDPQHFYPEFGTYEVCLRLSAIDVCPQTICQDLTVDEMVSFYPNPFSNELRLHFQQDISDDVLVELYTTEGSQISTSIIENPSIMTYSIDTRFMSAGSYLVKISTPGLTIVEKLIKI